MIKELTDEERQEIIEHTKRIAATMKTHRKGRYEFKAKNSNFATFAFAATEDIGNPDNAFFDDEANGYQPLDAVQKVRRIVENERARQDAIAYAESRNKTIRAGRERQAEVNKLEQNGNQSA